MPDQLDQPQIAPTALPGPSQGMGLPQPPPMQGLQVPPLAGPGLLDKLLMAGGAITSGLGGVPNTMLQQRQGQQQQAIEMQRYAQQQANTNYAQKLQLIGVQQRTEEMRMRGKENHLRLVREIGEVAPEFAAREYEKLGIFQKGEGAAYASAAYAKAHPEVLDEAVGIMLSGGDPAKENPQRYGGINIAALKGMSKPALEAAFPNHKAAATKRAAAEADLALKQLRLGAEQRRAAGQPTTADILADAKTPEEAGDQIMMYQVQHPERQLTPGEQKLVRAAQQKRDLDRRTKEQGIELKMLQAQRAGDQAEAATARAQLAQVNAEYNDHKLIADVAAINIKERQGGQLTPEEMVKKERFHLAHPGLKKPIPPAIAKSGEGVADLQQKLDRIHELLQDKEIQRNVGPGAGRMLTAKSMTGMGLTPKLAEFYSLINNVYIQAGKEQFGARFTQSEMAILDKAKMGQNQPLAQLEANWNVWNKSNQHRLKSLRAQAKQYATDGEEWVEGNGQTEDKANETDKHIDELLGR
jgi:hypothetical protein